MADTTHTPTPWDVNGEFIDPPPPYWDENGESHHSIAQAFGPNYKANAEFIVRAVNAHDDLLAACKLFATRFPAAIAALPDDERDLITAAIAKAEVQS